MDTYPYVCVPKRFLDREGFKGAHLYCKLAFIKDKKAIVYFLNENGKRDLYKRKLLKNGNSCYINIPFPIIEEIEGKELMRSTLTNDDELFAVNMLVNGKRAFVFFLEELDEDLEVI